MACLVALVLITTAVGLTAIGAAPSGHPLSASTEASSAGALAPSAGGPLTVTLVASPSTISLGQQTSLSGSVGGVSSKAKWLEYDWTILPVGCTASRLNTTATTTSLNCTPSEAQAFKVELTVNDSAGQAGNQTIALVVTGGGGSAALTATSLYLFAGLFGIAAALATAFVIITYLRRRSRRGPIAPVPPNPYIPPPGEGPP